MNPVDAANIYGVLSNQPVIEVICLLQSLHEQRRSNASLADAFSLQSPTERIGTKFSTAPVEQHAHEIAISVG